MESYGVVTEPRTVRLERIFPGPIERIWAYLTESDKREKWLARGEMDLRVGGKVELIFNNERLSSDTQTPERFKGAEGHKNEGHITRCEPPRLLAFTWGENHFDTPSEVTFELSPKGKDVLMVITHRRLSNRNGMVLVSGGWHTHTGVLADVLNNEEPRPFWKTFLGLQQEYEKRIAPE
jgi:uncharacterized protein YndB with AHSA1/START domain